MKEINGYVDISNLVHRTIQGYFNNLPAIKNARGKKSTFATQKEYKEFMDGVKDNVVKAQDDKIQYMLLHMSFSGFESMRKAFEAKEENHIALFDSKSWRKEEVKNFYENHEDETVEKALYKDGRANTYGELVKITLNNLEALLNELEYNTFKYYGLEADDLIALLIRNNKDRINKIGSNDIDFHQLQMQEGVEQYSPIKKEFVNFTPDEAQQELHLKTLVGDGSDNIPPVYNFKLTKKDGNEIKFPRLGEGTIKDIMSKYDITLGDNANEIIEDISLKIFVQQFTTPPFRKKAVDTLKAYTKEKVNSETHSEVLANYKELLEEEKTYIEKQIATQEKKLKKIESDQDFDNIYEELKVVPLDNWDDSNYEEDTQKIVLKLKTLQSTKILLENFSIEFSFEDIKNKILSQYNHNNTIINFDFIPEELKNNFLNSVTYKTQTKQGIARKRIFEKFKLPNLANSVKLEDVDVEEYYAEEMAEDNSQPEETPIQDANEENIPETIITTTNGNKYVQITGYVKPKIADYLEELSEKQVISKLVIGDEVSWIIKTKADDGDSEKVIAFNNTLLEKIKKASNNIKEEHANKTTNSNPKYKQPTF